MRRAGLAVVVMLIAFMTRTADAGACLDDEEFADAVTALETRVRAPKADMDYLRVCLPGAVVGPHATKQRNARVTAACTKILTREPADPQCVMLVAYQRKTELAGVQIFDAIVAWNSGPWSGPRLLGDWGSDQTSIDLALFGVLADSRAVPLVVERWKTYEIEAATREKKRRRSAVEMPAWASWRKQAAAVLGALGAASDIPFLAAQARATKDKAVRRACTAAIAAIRARSP